MDLSTQTILRFLHFGNFSFPLLQMFLFREKWIFRWLHSVMKFSDEDNSIQKTGELMLGYSLAFAGKIKGNRPKKPGDQAKQAGCHSRFFSRYPKYYGPNTSTLDDVKLLLGGSMWATAVCIFLFFPSDCWDWEPVPPSYQANAVVRRGVSFKQTVTRP